MEVAELWAARTAGDLHRVLVLYPPIRRSADAHEPFALLAKHHEIEPASSAATAMLLLTDPRWRDGVGNLVRRIAASALLDGEHLDHLAEDFLAADDVVFWEIPADWFSDEGIVIDLGDPGFPDDEPDDEELNDDDEGPPLARRVIAPPLRRWASEWMARHNPSAWSSLLARARDLDARSAAAIVTGLLDAIECLDPQVQQRLITHATGWPDQAVRRSGFALVAERDGPEAAYALGKDDPNARVRAWVLSLVDPGTSQNQPADTEVPQDAPVVDSLEPPTLF